MAISEKELDDKRQRNEKLRTQVAEEQAKQTAREVEVVNDVVATQLDAEAVRLEAALAAAKERNKAGAVKAGIAAPLGAAKDDLANAEAHLKAEDARRAEQARLVADAKAADADGTADLKAAASKAKSDAPTTVEKAAIDAKLAGDINEIKES